MPTLVLLRHGKSDWSGGHVDRDRPLAPRGRRQAAEAGRWIATRGPALDRAVVSPARRAAETWALAAAELDDPPPVVHPEEAYAFHGSELEDLLQRLPESAAVALVGHNPALEELLGSLTGSSLPLPTSCLAVVQWEGSWPEPREARLLAHGRPPA